MILARVVLAVGLIHAVVIDAHGGLSAPPESHVEPMADGRHTLVFLSYVPVEEDEGRIAMLPDGTQVDLRSTFSASGCYEIATRKPLWTAPWDGHEIWNVTDDCRHLIRVNYRGCGDFDMWLGGPLSWGLKFYDRGAEIKEYRVARLVDYPSLMPFTGNGGNPYDWIGDDSDNPMIQSHWFLFQTSTHERYRFDVTTGEIVEEFRLWRTLTRSGTALAAMMGVGLVALFSHRPKRVEHTVARPAVPANVTRVSGRRRFVSFSLRTLLVVTTGLALLFGLGFRWPHVALLTMSLTGALLVTRRTLRLRRASGWTRRNAWFGVYVAATLIAWTWCYLLSFPPVRGLLYWLRAPEDVHMAIILTIYRPFVWVFYYGGGDLLKPLEWYTEAWGIR